MMMHGDGMPTDGLASQAAGIPASGADAAARVAASPRKAEWRIIKVGPATFEAHVFPGAAHGFLRMQEAGGGPNFEGAKAAWPLTVAWFRKHLAP
jgi:dienelactone hydrolase